MRGGPADDGQSVPLARVFDDEMLHGQRGPDVRFELIVPALWLQQRAWVEFVLPARLACAACEGGGCDACARRGAVRTRTVDASDETVRVQLPAQQDGAVLRLLQQGGLGIDASMARGHLLLVVRAGDVQNSSVKRLDFQPVAVGETGEQRTHEGARAMGLAALVAAMIAVMSVVGWMMMRSG